MTQLYLTKEEAAAIHAAILGLRAVDATLDDARLFRTKSDGAVWREVHVRDEAFGVISVYVTDSKAYERYTSLDAFAAAYGVLLIVPAQLPTKEQAEAIVRGTDFEFNWTWWDKERDCPGWANGEIMLDGTFTVEQLRAVLFFAPKGN